MINHIRTLLLNQSSAALPEAGDEYVPDEARSRELTPRLRTLHETLFGATPDRLMLNYRLYQLMTAIHESSHADIATSLDPRITYLLDRQRLLWPFPMSTFQLTQTPIGDELPAFVSKTVSPTVDRQGVCRQTLRLTVGNDEATWTWLRNGRAPIVVTAPSVVDGRISLDVPTGGYRVSVPNTFGAAWIFEIAYKPQLLLTDVEQALLAISGDVSAAMMGGVATATPEAPYDALLTSWVSPVTPVDRVAAAALTLALRTDALP